MQLNEECPNTKNMSFFNIDNGAIPAAIAAGLGAIQYRQFVAQEDIDWEGAMDAAKKMASGVGKFVKKKIIKRASNAAETVADKTSDLVNKYT